MGTQLWIRNPRLYIKEVVGAGLLRTSWDEGYLKKHRVDVQKYLSLYYPPDMDWEAIVIGWSGARVVDAENSFRSPRKIHYVYSHEHHPEQALDDFAEESAKNDYEQMIVVTDLPNVRFTAGKMLISRLADLIDDHPGLKIFFHGSYSFPAMFGHDWYAVDHEAREVAKKQQVWLPNGRRINIKDDRELLGESLQWVNLLGFRISELEEPRNRCIYNIHAALWASRHWDDNFKFKTRKERYSIEVPDEDFVPPETNRYKPIRHTFDDEYDKLLCNTCSVQRSCKFFRLGSVCSVPGAEPTKLADMFNTRDADRIIKGLGTVLAAQSNRAEEAMEDEAATGELSPEVTKILNSLFSNGVKLAKLVNPSLNGKGVSVGIQLNGSGSATIAAANSANQLTAAVVATLESKGIPREEITPSMIATVLEEADSESDLLELDMSGKADEDE